MTDDTEDEEKICSPANIHECPHFDYVNPDDPDVDKGEEYLHVGALLPPQYVFYIQRIADRHFPQADSKKPHPGNKSRAIKELLKYGIQRYNQVGKQGTFKEIMHDEYGHQKEAELRQAVESLHYEMDVMQEKLQKKNREIKDLKRDYGIVKDNSDIIIHILDLLKDEALPLDGLVDRLQEEKDVEFKDYQHPLDPDTKIGLKGLTDFFLDHLLEKGSIEVRRENGRTLYEA